RDGLRGIDESLFALLRGDEDLLECNRRAPGSSFIVFLLYGSRARRRSLIHLSQAKSVPEGPRGLRVSARLILAVGSLTPRLGRGPLRGRGTGRGYDGDGVLIEIAVRES